MESMNDTCINTTKKSELTNHQREIIAQTLLEQSKNGRLDNGSINKMAGRFSVSRKTISRIWKQAQACITNGEKIDVSTKLSKNVGRRRIEIEYDQIKDIPLRRRTNIRSMANALNKKKSTDHRRIKDGKIKPHTNTLKPYLTEENKIARLKFCLSMINEGTFETLPKFIDMYNYIHIDEKWFFLTKTTEKYYLHPMESEPLRTYKSKRFITKIMFLAAIARPRLDTLHNEMFSGKIGIFPFVYKEPAKRNSKNRQAGTLETEPIISITKDVTRSCLITKLIPAIRDSWPLRDRGPIYIQQDNAKPHIDVNDVEFLEAAKKECLDIQLSQQPPNSPDMNVLDLGFFRAIQSLQHQEAPSTVDELVLAVEKAFNHMPTEALNFVFLTLQSCMIEVCKNFGGNNYKIPHMNKHKLEREGQIPIALECDPNIVSEAKNYLQG